MSDKTPPKTDFLKTALALLEHGYVVLPCKTDKKPLTKRGFKDATRVPDVIKQWADKWPNAQVAIACAASGLVVVDIDDHEAWGRLLRENGLSEPLTRSVSTPSGGRHLYFRAMSEAAYKSSLGAGIDVKHNGYAL